MDRKEIQNRINELDAILYDSIKESIREGEVFRFLDLCPVFQAESEEGRNNESVAVVSIWSDPLGPTESTGLPEIYAECKPFNSRIGIQKECEPMFIPISIFLLEDKKYILDQIAEVKAVYGEERPYRSY